MPKRGNKDTRVWKLRGTREAERYRDSRREERR